MPVRISSTYLLSTSNRRRCPNAPAWTLKDIFTSGGRIKTHNNELYVRSIWEVEERKIKYDKKWKLYENGGESLKWYGNKSYVVNWNDKALEEYKFNPELYFIK